MKQEIKNFSTIAASEICRLEQIIKEKDLIIYGIEEGAEEWKAKCNDLEYQLRQQSDKKWSDEDMARIQERVNTFTEKLIANLTSDAEDDLVGAVALYRIISELKHVTSIQPSEPKQVYGVEDMIGFAEWASGEGWVYARLAKRWVNTYDDEVNSTISDLLKIYEDERRGKK